MTERDEPFIYISSKMYLKCRTNSYSNFIKDKIYDAIAYDREPNGFYSDYHVRDENGEFILITKQLIIKLFQITEGGNLNE